MTMAGDQNLDSGNTWWGSNLTAAVLNGTIPQWRLDDMVVRIMSAYYKVRVQCGNIVIITSTNLFKLGRQRYGFSSNQLQFVDPSD